jgi:hypothetical protein
LFNGPCKAALKFFEDRRRPSALTETDDNPEGVDAVSSGAFRKRSARTAMRFLTEFFNNFYNTDLLLGKRVNRQALACLGIGSNRFESRTARHYG